MLIGVIEEKKRDGRSRKGYLQDLDGRKRFSVEKNRNKANY